MDDRKFYGPVCSECEETHTHFQFSIHGSNWVCMNCGFSWNVQTIMEGTLMNTPKLGRTRQAKARKARKVHVRCDQCEMLSINGVACHETGCPNSGATWSEHRQEWVHYYECHVDQP